MGLGIPEVFIILIILAVVLFVCVMLVDVLKSRRPLAEKVVWAIGLAVLLPFSAPYYFFTEYKKK